jgi:hypothetical protein
VIAVVGAQEGKRVELRQAAETSGRSAVALVVSSVLCRKIRLSVLPETETELVGF